MASISKIKQLYLLAQNMGFRAFLFRARYEVQKKTGILRKKFPTEVPDHRFVSLEDWKNSKAQFFFSSKEELGDFLPLSPEDSQELADEFENLMQGKVKFFNAFYLELGKNYNWTTHPETKHAYTVDQHWTQIPDLDPIKGDIKYVWEKSRFSFVYMVLRHDRYFEQDHSEWLLGQIVDWIDKNPLNCGPNYVCSQEISLRVLNWTYALHYYKHSAYLTEAVFQKIIHSIYWQIKHVEANIQFSRIAVRNNHAITECLGLYLTGLIYPFFPESVAWKTNGKAWLEEEGLYQIYPDGSYLQFSMNYHRVVIQLFTWAFYLAEANSDTFSQSLYERLQKSLDLLYQHQDVNAGNLPNYGANDGALFFKLNSCHYRDFRPQLNALYYFFHRSRLYEPGLWQEDLYWYGKKIHKSTIPVTQASQSYTNGGFYVLRDTTKFAFIRCGKHKDRPSQADNLHMDIWWNGKNIMRDAGSYKYNASPEDIRFFMGTASHNTIQLAEYDQMQKGGRFIWYYWSQAVEGSVSEDDEAIYFEGTAHVYRHVHPQIFHIRQVKQYKNAVKWEIHDTLTCPQNLVLKGLAKKQIWNIHPDFFGMGFRISAKNIDGSTIPPATREGYYSTYYGVKEPANQLVFQTYGNQLVTFIELP